MPRPTPVSDYISCIIPTHNEQDRIVGVVHAALNSDLFDKVVVVDDASSDYTTWALDTFFMRHRITVLKLPTRIGKSRAVAHAFSTLPRSKFVCLLDGDLIGLTARHLEALADPVMEGRVVPQLAVVGRGRGCGRGWIFCQGRGCCRGGCWMRQGWIGARQWGWRWPSMTYSLGIARRLPW